MPARRVATSLEPIAYVRSPKRVRARIRPNTIASTMLISTGNGSHPFSTESVVPSALIGAGSVATSLPPLSRSVPPVIPVSVPRVTMNGGRLMRVINSPLIRPRPVPAPSITRIETIVVSVELSCTPSMCWATSAPAIPEKPSIAPTDRSIPAVMITNVSPIARIRYSTA